MHFNLYLCLLFVQMWRFFINFLTESHKFQRIEYYCRHAGFGRMTNIVPTKTSRIYLLSFLPFYFFLFPPSFLITLYIIWSSLVLIHIVLK